MELKLLSAQILACENTDTGHTNTYPTLIKTACLI